MANTVVNAWTVSPTRRCVEVPPPVAEKVTSFGHRVVARAFSYDVVLLACCCLCSVMPDSATPWTAAHQAPRSMGFPRQEHWSGPPFLLQGIFPTPGSNPCLLQLLHYRQILYCWAIRESRVALIQYDWCPYKKMARVVRWLRIHLAVQGTWVRSLIWDDPTSMEQLSPWTTTAEPML